MNKYTLKQFNKQFTNDEACLEYLKNYLYPDGIFCEKCQKITPHARLTHRKAYSCSKCGTHTYPMVNTIFKDSSTSLKNWFYAIFLMSHTRCGISAKQLQRELGVTYKTAWRMFHKIRDLLNENTRQLHGKVELDEAYIGGEYHAGKQGMQLANKSIVFGMVERDGIVKAVKVDDLKKTTVIPLIQKNVNQNSIIYTDEYQGHRDIWAMGYRHKVVSHKEKQWVIGDAHTNTIEGFWSLLKRSINGVYHAVSKKYMQAYVNEYAFRYNHREDENPMFLTMMKRI